METSLPSEHFSSNGPEDVEWQQLHRTWEEYEATGFGYKDFARREFAKYQYSLPVAANPFTNLNLQELEKMMNDSNKPLRDRILAAESLIHRDPTNQNSLALSRLPSTSE